MSSCSRAQTKADESGTNHQAVEAVEYGEDNDKRRCTHGHARNPYARNHVDHIVRFPGEQIAEGEFQRQLCHSE